MSDERGGQFLRKYLRCFNEEMLDKSEINRENTCRQNRKFENSDIDSDWENLLLKTYFLQPL